MEHENIIHNILIESEQKTHCLNTLVQLEENDAPTVELLHASRFLALEKIDFDNPVNATNTFIDIYHELNKYVLPNDVLANTDNDTIESLKISSAIDTILQKLSINERKIYIYRYFFLCPIDNIASICNCSSSSVAKSISLANSSLKAQLKNANLCSSIKTLIESFADIDNKYLMDAINNTANANAIVEDNNVITKNNRLPKKVNFFSNKKAINICFAVIIVALITVNIMFISNNKKIKNASKTSSTNENTSDETIDLDYIFTSGYNGETVNIDALLSYYDITGNENSIICYTTENFTADYYNIPLKASVPLDACLGDEIASFDSSYTSYYKLKGHNNAKYMIVKTMDLYELYALSYISLNSEAYESMDTRDISCFEIANNFLGLSNSDQIKSIAIKDQNVSSNFDDINVKKLLTGEKEIADIFLTLTLSKLAYDIVVYHEQIPYEYLANTSVQLIIELMDGTVIDTLYYRPGHYYFYDITSNLVFSFADQYDEEESSSLGKLVDTLLSFDNHNTEPTDPKEWHIICDIASIAYDNITISLHQDETAGIVNGLYLSEDWFLERWENNTWVKLPYRNDYTQEDYFPFYMPIYPNGTYLTTSMYFKTKYKVPTVGKYRLAYTIYDSNSENINDPASKQYYIEFEITEEDLDYDIFGTN